MSCSRERLAALDIRLLVDHRERLVRIRVAVYNDLLWHLHDLWARADLSGLRLVVEEVVDLDRAPAGSQRADRPGPDRPRRAASSARALPDDQRAGGRNRAARRPSRAAVAGRAGLRSADSRQADRRDRRRSALLKRRQARARRRDRPRFPSAPATPTATASDRGGNRQINTAIHRVAITRLRCHPETQANIARKRRGKSTTEAIRCLKRHLARRIWHLLQPAPTELKHSPARMPRPPDD